MILMSHLKTFLRNFSSNNFPTPTPQRQGNPDHDYAIQDDDNEGGGTSEEEEEESAE